MKITPNPAVIQALQTYNKNRTTAAKKADTVVAAQDKIELSPKAMEFQTALKAIKALPEIRQHRVDEVKAKMEKGEMATPEQVAERMMSEINRNSKL